MPPFDPTSTALVLIDLQKGILGRPTRPHAPADIVERAGVLAARFRAAGAPVFPVRVGFAPDFGDLPPQNVDAPVDRMLRDMPEDWGNLADGVAAPGDIVIVKRQWGAFTGTELDVQLRRRGIKTIVIGGVATNFGVESTVRHGWELGYEFAVVEDLCASVSAELHDVAISTILPRLSRVVTLADVALAA